MMVRSGICRGCGKSVVWVRTTKGRNMPCEPQFRAYRETDEPAQKVILSTGEIVNAVIVDGTEANDGLGRLSHFASCPAARKISEHGQAKGGET